MFRPTPGLRRVLALAWLAALMAGGCSQRADGPPARKHSNIERLALDRLRAVHADVEAIKARRVALPSRPGWNDYRCILHAHADDSTHTGGTLPEMLADAKRAGVAAIFLTDHFRPPRDFIDGRWRGLKDGVLFVPGAEARGFLLHPTQSILKQMNQPAPELVTTSTAGDGMIYLSHIEERPDHATAGLTGMEIYNRHWDAKRDRASLFALAYKLTDPKQLAELEEALRLYPAEVLAFQCDYPQAYLEKWDAATRTQRLTGVAANDCHHNQVLVVKMVDESHVLLGTNVDADDKMRKMSALLRPGIKELTRGRQPGDILARLDVDPYHRSFWNVSTHILAPQLDELTLRTALKSGHAYVAHDWMCDPTGFDFAAFDAQGRRAGEMGDEIKHHAGLTLRARLPVGAYVRVLRHGEAVATAEGTADFSYSPKEAGVYRFEAWLKLDGEWRPWIFSNPVYVR